MHSIDLSPQVNGEERSWLGIAAANMTLVLLASTLFPASPLLREFSTILHNYTLDKANELSEYFTESSLALNFLANERQLDPQARLAFASSGLTHLLALSGAQIQPVCSILGWMSAWLALGFGQRVLSPSALSRATGWLKTTMELTSALLLAAIYGASGAILRVALFAYLFRIVFLLAYRFGSSSGERGPLVAARAIVLVCATMLLGNPFANLSFLLSAIGAGISSIVSFIHSDEAQQKRHWTSIILKQLSLSCAVSLCIGLLLFPLFRNNPLVAASANLAAGPLVGIIITPLSLLMLAFPSEISHSTGLTTLFDISLEALRNLADAFSGTNAVSGGLAMDVGSARLYLAFLLVAVWTIQDGRASKGYLRICPKVPSVRSR